MRHIEIYSAISRHRQPHVVRISIDCYLRIAVLEEIFRIFSFIILSVDPDMATSG